ncbi:MAG: hypothetical protein JJ921_12565 [Pseudomonadales bacterium]|nr:hypothetical protein [Pseudomonadales bacterium]MBO6597345.1 hypothetical protein [Pseudomonadales bacterium]MBO6703161.1 hypothetical protein [Pseudomonadales bacterium]MBO6824079.1 hypothetical protein [Pseudomonadales bacterium]MBO7007184.1 hypothetical protein [Pseudomonadales bacterium]
MKLIATCILFASLMASGGCEREAPETKGLLVDPSVLGNSVSNWQGERMNQSIASMTVLNNQTNRFLEAPDEARRQTWQSAWHQAHEDFHHATVLVEPIILQDIDVWPIAPGFLDALPEYPASGIISDLSVEITSATLNEQHMITDTSEAALGFHVLEYYAFERPIEDMQLKADALSERRRVLIRKVSDRLLTRVMNLRQSLKADEGDALPQATYPELVSKLTKRTNDISSALNFSSEHGEYGGRGAQVIREEFSAISELLNGEVNINRYLMSLSEQQTQVLNTTLNDAITLISIDGDLTESDSSRLQLLAAAISHQFEDFDAERSR